MKHLLLIQSDDEFRSTLATYLRDFFEVSESNSFKNAWTTLTSKSPDLVIFESLGSDLDEARFIKNIRNDTSLRQTGVIVLTDSIQGEEQFFLSGADLVLPRNTKPNAIVLRLSALLQRISGFQSLQEIPLQMGVLLIDPKTKTVNCNGIEVSLTPIQFELVMAFACHPGQVLTRDWLKQNVWKQGRVSARSVDAHISKLKRILPALHAHISNVYGEGYIFLPPKKAA